MSHYEKRLEEDLHRIRASIAGMATQVQTGIKQAVQALQTGNQRLAAATILADHPINRRMREVDQLCHRFIAVHLPSAGHLRLLSAAIRANIALERIGDYAVTIARVSEQLLAPPKGEISRELDRLANEAQTMLEQSITAFNDLNAEMAKATMVLEQEMEYDLDTVYGELTSNQDREKIRELLAVVVVLTHLKRVADQAKNLCEETVFAVTGETKAPKVYNILFVDEGNSCMSQMAEAVARKTFPGSGNYSSAGARPAASVNAAMVRFLGDHGFDLSAARPRPLELSPHQLFEQHVIVSLQGPVRNYVPKLPFHTTALEWDVGSAPAGGDDAEITERLEAIYREIALQVRDLMETLRGEDAP
jgi:phosphate transport system protein